MPITRTPIADDDGTGTTGTVIDNAWKQQFYDQIDALADAPWVDIPYDPARFFTDDGTQLTLTQQINRYKPFGSLYFWQFGGNPMTIPKATNLIYVTTPFAFGTPATAVLPVSWCAVPAVLKISHSQAVAVAHSDGGAWASGNIWLYWSIFL